MFIIKSSGEKQKFSSKKIYYSLLDAGTPKNLAKEITDVIKKEAYNNIHTEEIQKIILQRLKDHKAIAQRYNLKKAIMSLGPAGYLFERFFAKVLNEYGYRTEVGRHYKGKNVSQEIDITTTDTKNKKFMIECKYHNEAGIYTGMKVAMYTYARFLDVQKHGFNQPWLATNTNCSINAKSYAKGVNLKITAWKFPEEESLRSLIEQKKLYPITILNLKEEQKEKFTKNNFLLLKEIIGSPSNFLSKKTGIKISELDRLKKEGKEILNYNE